MSIYLPVGVTDADIDRHFGPADDAYDLYLQGFWNDQRDEYRLAQQDEPTLTWAQWEVECERPMDYGEWLDDEREADEATRGDELYHRLKEEGRL